jgi:hypothetical protein
MLYVMFPLHLICVGRLSASIAMFHVASYLRCHASHIMNMLDLYRSSKIASDVSFPVLFCFFADRTRR